MFGQILLKMCFAWKLQMPTIVLGQDEVDCFAAWVSAEAGLPEHVETGSDLKVADYILLHFITSVLISLL